MLTTFYFLNAIPTTRIQKRETYCEARITTPSPWANFCSFPYEFYFSTSHHWIIKIPKYPLNLLTCYISRILTSPFGFIVQSEDILIMKAGRGGMRQLPSLPPPNAGFVGRRLSCQDTTFSLFSIPAHWSLLLFSFSVSLPFTHFFFF